MIDIQDKHFAILQQILHAYIPNIPVWVFGSRIKGTAKPYSDLDIVIVGQQKIPQNTYYQIQDAFEESELPYRVDVLDWHRISDEFRALIQQKYVILSK